MSKTAENQEVRSFGIISLFFLIGAAAMVWVPTWNGRSADNREHTLRRAESLAYQLLESHRVASRGPASVQENSLNQLTSEQGRIGSDPWGHPYNFKLLKSADGQRTKVVVWSFGPNGQSETPAEFLDSNRDKDNPTFEGDDLGVMVSIK